MLRSLLADLTPTVLKDWHEIRRTRRRVSEVSPLIAEYVARNGTAVAHGPFRGMRYPRELADIPKLVGTYESQLNDVVERIVATRPAVLVDIGSAEGYYAVGFALRMRGARVQAHDIDSGARGRCTALAALNGVADRVQVCGECTHDTLNALPLSGVVLMLDCEGAERDLLRPDLVPALAQWPVLVELHDFLSPGLTDELRRRFTATHDIDLISEVQVDGAGIPELGFMTPRQRAVALDEFRPARMRWASMIPRV